MGFKAGHGRGGGQEAGILETFFDYKASTTGLRLRGADYLGKRIQEAAPLSALSSD
jgi:hypothetical protein